MTFNRKTWAKTAIENGASPFSRELNKRTGDEFGLSHFFHPYITTPSLKNRIQPSIEVNDELQKLCAQFMVRLATFSRLEKDKNGEAVPLNPESPSNGGNRRQNSGLLFVLRNKATRDKFVETLKETSDFIELFDEEENIVYTGEELIKLDPKWDEFFKGVMTGGRSGHPKPVSLDQCLVLAAPSVAEFPEEGLWRNIRKDDDEDLTQDGAVPLSGEEVVSSMENQEADEPVA